MVKRAEVTSPYQKTLGDGSPTKNCQNQPVKLVSQRKKETKMLQVIGKATVAKATGKTVRLDGLFLSTKL